MFEAMKAVAWTSAKPLAGKASSCTSGRITAVPRPAFRPETLAGPRIAQDSASARARRARVVVTRASAGGSSTVRRLILLRHAESQEAGAVVKDYDRQVTDGGKEEAQLVAKELAARHWMPDQILCSPSTRTRQTLEAMGMAVSAFGEVEVAYVQTFYTAAALDGHTRPELERTIAELEHGAGDGGDSNSFETVMCMGHNKGWEEAASSFAGEPIQLETSTAALLEASGDTWKEAFANGFTLHGIVSPDDTAAAAGTASPSAAS